MTRTEILQTAKPILFNAPMVLTILDGRKTVTRRIVKFQKGWNPYWTGYVTDGSVLYGRNNIPAAKSPYKPDDYLYVREAWCKWWGYHYRVDDGTDVEFHQVCYDQKWEPSIHMPKEAARIFLRVKDVRPEKLQDIKEDGAICEGACGYLTEGKFRVSPVCHFMEIWDSTIKPKDRGKYGWEANPWVWVIEFEKVEVGF